MAYRPEEHFSFEPQGYDLDDLALQCQKILNTEYSEKLDELYLLGGTSGGARPKIMTEIDRGLDYKVPSSCRRSGCRRDGV